MTRSYSALLLETNDEEGQIQVLSAAVEVVIAFLNRTQHVFGLFSVLVCLLVLIAFYIE